LSRPHARLIARPLDKNLLTSVLPIRLLLQPGGRIYEFKTGYRHQAVVSTAGGHHPDASRAGYPDKALMRTKHGGFRMATPARVDERSEDRAPRRAWSRLFFTLEY